MGCYGKKFAVFSYLGDVDGLFVLKATALGGKSRTCDVAAWNFCKSTSLMSKTKLYHSCHLPTEIGSNTISF